jgi:hypothetical protein
MLYSSTRMVVHMYYQYQWYTCTIGTRVQIYISQKRKNVAWYVHVYSTYHVGTRVLHVYVHVYIHVYVLIMLCHNFLIGTGTHVH